MEVNTGTHSVRGREHHISVDMQGWPLQIKARAADIADREGGPRSPEGVRKEIPRLTHSRACGA